MHEVTSLAEDPQRRRDVTVTRDGQASKAHATGQSKGNSYRDNLIPCMAHRVLPCDPERLPHRKPSRKVIKTMTHTVDTPTTAIPTASTHPLSTLLPHADLAEVAPGLWAGIVDISSDDAARILTEANHSNRPLKKSVLETYARDLAAGAWALTGEPLIFDSEGQLLNGQHRLNGAVVSGHALKTLVVAGVAPKAFRYLDSGEKRRGADVLALLGEKNTKLLQATLRLLYSFDTGELGSQKRSPSNAELEDELLKHSAIRDVVGTLDRVKGASESALTTLRYLFNRVDQGRAETFFARLADGVGLDATSPIYVLRERLSKEYKKLPTREVLALVIKTWNAYLTAAIIRRISWSAKKEPFPKILGLEIEWSR